MSGAGVIRQHVFCWMIANCDRGGIVEVNPRLLAAMFGPPATPDAVAEALSWLAMSDPMSRTKERDGQRIEHIDAFLWHIINYSTYRDLVKAEEIREQTRLRVQRFRDRNAKTPDRNAEVTDGNAEVTPDRRQTSDDKGQESESISSDLTDPTHHSGNGRAKGTKTKPESDQEFLDTFEKIWQLYPRHDGKAKSLKLVWSVLQKGGEPELQLLANATGHYARARRGENPDFTMIGPTFYGGRWRDWVNGDPKPKFNPNRNPRL